MSAFPLFVVPALVYSGLSCPLIPWGNLHFLLLQDPFLFQGQIAR
jgi:hypothetical protein